MADGGRTAFHVLGGGSPLAVLFPYHINHLTLNWRVPLHRGAIEFLARHFTVINLDFRGAGLSDGLNGELSLELFAESLSAVLAETGAERVAIVAMGAAGMRDAWQHDYATITVADCCAEIGEGSHDASLAWTARNFGTVRTSAELSGPWRARATAGG